MDKLTPSAQRTLDALTAGPGNVHELSERTSRSRSTTDKAIGDLARAGLIVKVDHGGDPADGTPTRWQLADPTPTTDENSQPTDAAPTTEPDPNTTGTAETDTVTAAEPAPPGDTPDPADEPQPNTADASTADRDHLSTGSDTDSQPASAATPHGQSTTRGNAPVDREAKQDGDQQTEAEPPKLCRGCQAQMPKICQSCWQKTPTYCGTCRRTMPQLRRGQPGEPVILANGLPKLRPGELEELILTVMREQPLPRHTGIVGWTGGRVAIFLPGRSPSAISNALDKFSRTGICELIGDNPMRYQLTPTKADTDTPSTPGSGEPGPDTPSGQPGTTA